MKKFLLILVLVLFCMSLHAEKIPLKDKPPKENGSGGIKDKSEILVPNAEIENGVINIETALASWGVSVTVYNNNCNIWEWRKIVKND